MLDHAPLSVPILEGLVHQLDCAGLGKVGVCVDDVGHPFEPLVCSLVLPVDVEAGVGGILPGEGLVLLLGTWCAVQVDDDVEPGILGPFADSLEVLECPLGEVLTVGINQVLVDPVS